MLQGLRDYLPRWLTAAMLGALIGSIIFVGLYSPKNQESKSFNAPILRVNKKTIRRATLDNAFERLKQQKQVQLGANFKMTPVMEQELRQQALTQLVVSEVLKQSAYQQGYRIHPLDLERELHNIPIFQVAQKFSAARFEEVIRTAGYTKQSFFKALKQDKLIAQLKEAILKTTIVLPHEIKTALRLINQQRDFEYSEIKPDIVLKQISKPSLKEMKEYYHQNLSAFRKPEQVKIDYVLVALSDYLKQLKALHPVWTQEKLKNEALKKFEGAFEQLSNIAQSTPYSLNKIANHFNVPVQCTESFSRSGGNSDITNQPEVVTAAFSKAVLEGRNSEILTLDGNRIIVLRLRDYQPLRLPEFQEVRSQIQDQLMHKKAEKQTKLYVEELVAKLRVNPKQTHFATANLYWKKVLNMTRYSKAEPSGILNAAFKIPLYSADKGVQFFQLRNGSYVIIRLLKIKDGNSIVPTSKQTLYQKELAIEQGELEYHLYVQSKLEQYRDQIGPRLNF